MDVERIEQLSKKLGGRFRLTTLLQKRLSELVKGSPPLVDLPPRNYMEIALREVEEGRIELIEAPAIEEPEQIEAPSTEDE